MSLQDPRLLLPQLRADQLSIVRHPAKVKVIACGRRFGKALDVNTRIPTPSGWTTMGQLRVGDFVFDEHGLPCRVVGATGIMTDRPCYRLRFSDGTEIIADGEHQWRTWSHADKKNSKRLPHLGHGPRVRTTREIADTLTVGTRADYNHFVELAGAAQYPAADLPIAPYTLGAWLGDGSAVHGVITSADPELLERIEQDGYQVAKKKQPLAYRITGQPSVDVNGYSHPYSAKQSLQAQLRRAGLLDNKHIPDEYLTASVEQRIELLRGLMDTDGHVSANGACEFTSINPILADNVLELTRSLGLRSTLRVGDATFNGRVVSKKYRVLFSPDRQVFSLSRKAAVLEPFLKKRKLTRFRTIVAVDPIDSVPVRCIEVDSPSRLYLASEAYIPTHNSVLGMSMGLLAASLGARVAWVVPQYRNGRPLWRMAEAACRELAAVKMVRMDKQERVIQFKDSLGELAIYSTENPDAILGENFHLLIVDEAARIDEDSYYRALVPLVADTDGDIVLISTPNGLNWFHTEYLRGLDDGQVQASFHAPTYANPIPSIRAAYHKARSILPARVFEQEWDAKFIGDGQLFSNVRANIEDTWLEAPPKSIQRQYAIGVDLAKSVDFTVFVVIDATDEVKRVVWLERLQNVDYDSQLVRLSEVCQVWKPTSVVIETNANAFFVEKAEQTIDNVVPFTTTKESKPKVIHQLMADFEASTIRIPDDPHLVGELMNFKSLTLPSGHVRYSAPPGAHDDMVMALAFANHGAANAAGWSSFMI